MLKVKSVYEGAKILAVEDHLNYIIQRELVPSPCVGENEPDMEMGVCYAKPSNQYIGDIATADYLCRQRGITDLQAPTGKVCSIGWQAVEKKWYGWSHRAIYGFGVGSTVKKGDCGYLPVDRADFVEESLKFWEVGTGKWIDCESKLVKRNKKLLGIEYDVEEEVYTCDAVDPEVPGNERTDKPIASEPSSSDTVDIIKGIRIKYFVKFKGLPRGTKRAKGYEMSIFAPYPVYGKGTWTAKTLKDAKQMAIEFAEGVS